MTDPLTTLLSIHEKAMATPWRARSDATVSTARDSFAHEVVMLKPTTHEGLDPGQMADNAAAVASAMNALPRLIAELREAQADTRRLDWLEANMHVANRNTGCVLNLSDYFTVNESKGGATLREAIDTAMQSE
jgi:hypothetical protein